MIRMPRWRLRVFLIVLASLATTPGCSDSSPGVIDQRAAMQKATGGDGKVRQSEKARADSEEAAKKHPKLY
jgi:hypothetical protein